MAAFANPAPERIWSQEFRHMVKSALASTALETLACGTIATKPGVRRSHHGTNAYTLPREHSGVRGHVDRIFM